METENLKIVMSSLEKLAEKLGKTTEQIFTWYVKRAKMQIYYYIINQILYVLLLLLGLFLANIDYSIVIIWKANFIQYAIFAIGIVFSYIGLISFVAELFEYEKAINAKINPEYEAIEQLLDKLQSDND